LLRDHIPGVLFIDDLQWADSTTLDFLAYFLRRLKGQNFLLLIAWRNDELQGSLRLQKILTEMHRAGIGNRLSLKRLEYKDVLDLVRVSGPQIGSTPSNFQEKLFQETEGLPYFLIEYLNMILQQHVETGDWGQEPLEWQMPPSVRDLLRVRTQNLDELSRQLLTSAAAIGRSFDFDTLLSASGRSEIETIAGLENLISHGLIEECSSCDTLHSVHYDFTHEKLRSLVYDETSLMRRHLLHRRIAEALMNARRQYANPEAVESKIALHLHLAGEEMQAGDHYILAGDYARSLFANREALVHYQSALASGYPVSADLLITIADMQTLLGEYRSALSSCQQASQIAEYADQARIRHKIGRIQLRAGQPQDAIEQFKAVVENTEGGAALTRCGRIFADWSLAAYLLGDVEKAEQLAQVSLTHALTSEDREAATQAYNLLGILARFKGDFLLAHQELIRSIQLAEESGDLDAKAAALNNLALVLADEGDFFQAIQITNQALEISERLGDRHRAAALRNNLADLYHKTGQSEKSMEELRKAVVGFAEIGEQATELRPEIWKLTEW
jgi:predicted ATPase